MNFQGKNILVVGASSGMGKEIVYHLHSLGAQVVMVARSENLLKDIATELSERIYYYSYDMNDINNIKNIFLFCRENGIQLDGLVYTVGMCDMVPIRSMSYERAMESMKVNCLAFLELGKFFSSKRYSNDNSSIVAISSYESILCDKGQSLYAGSKSSLEAFVRVMSKEFVSRKIRANAILPAIVDTPMLHRNQESGNYAYDEISTIQALGVIDPKQIAYLTAFLLSDQALYITGESICVSAGWIGEK